MDGSHSDKKIDTAPPFWKKSSGAAFPKLVRRYSPDEFD
jgi:hypothetical protein